MNTYKEHLRKKLLLLPQSPGIYQFLDDHASVLYVGKAKNLKDRVSSYFQKDPERELSKILIDAIRDFRFVTTPSEQQALFLEHKLIQNHNPPFNTKLRYTGFPFPYIKLVFKKYKLSLYKTRNFFPENGTYFGPYADVPIATNLVKLLNYLLPIDSRSFYHQERSLPMSIPSLRRRISNFLKASDENLIKKLQIHMRRAAKVQKFIVASICKDLIYRIQSKISSINPSQNKSSSFLQTPLLCQDVVNFFPNESGILLCVFRMDQDIVLYKFSSFCPLPKHIALTFLHKNPLEDVAKINLLLALQQLYAHQKPSHQISHILLPFELCQIPSEKFSSTLQELTSQIEQPQNDAPSIVYAQNSSLDKLLLAKNEAKAIFLSHHQSLFLNTNSLNSIQEILHLDQPPSIIDAFDIANTEDQFIMGGVVRFVEGSPNRSLYRIFNIRGTSHRDDFFSIYESVYRRYLQSIQKNYPLPQLILIDGGKGQLSFAYKALKKLHLQHTIFLVSLAKKEEQLFIINHPQPLQIQKNHPGLLFLMSIRDEVHNFINKKHRTKRDSWIL